MAGLSHSFGACMRPEARNVVNLLLLVVLLPLLGEVRGEDIVHSNLLPSVPPNKFGRQKNTESRLLDDHLLVSVW